MSVHSLFGWSFMKSKDLAEMTASVVAQQAASKREKDYLETEVGTLKNKCDALEKSIEGLSKHCKNLEERLRNSVPKQKRDGRGRFLKTH